MFTFKSLAISLRSFRCGWEMLLHILATVLVLLPNCSASHFCDLSLFTKTSFILFIRSPVFGDPFTIYTSLSVTNVNFYSLSINMLGTNIGWLLIPQFREHKFGIHLYNINMYKYKLNEYKKKQNVYSAPSPRATAIRSPA